jgi:hypothetical protein
MSITHEPLREEKWVVAPDRATARSRAARMFAGYSDLRGHVLHDTRESAEYRAGTDNDHGFSNERPVHVYKVVLTVEADPGTEDGHRVTEDGYRVAPPKLRTGPKEPRGHGQKLDGEPGAAS